MAPMRRPIRQAFTLIELLVVIAIIAILTAILLPVFASVREGARQGTSISNMKDIQQKMAQFKLDNHRYPDVLFGYADGLGSMKGALGRAQAYDTAHGTHTAALYFPGLYPAYIKDVEVFTDPNNPVNSSDAAQFTGQIPTNLVAPCNPTTDETLASTPATAVTTSPCTATGATGPKPGDVVSTQRNFYIADAYDASPTVIGTNQISNPAAYVVRYQIAREPTFVSTTTNPNADAAYNEQLRWQNPPAETLITATTYHVKNADKVLAIFESGAVKKITGHDFAALEGSGYTPTFWQVYNWPANIKP